MRGRGEGGVGHLFEFHWEGEGVGWALTRGWAFINFFCLYEGRILEVSTNSRLGVYSLILSGTVFVSVRSS